MPHYLITVSRIEDSGAKTEIETIELPITPVSQSECYKVLSAVRARTTPSLSGVALKTLLAVGDTIESPQSTVADGYTWLQIDLHNGENDQFTGRWCAKGSTDGKQEFCKQIECVDVQPEPEPENGIVQATRAPIIQRLYDGGVYYAFNIQNDFHSKIGANLRDLAFGDIKWPKNGISEEYIQKQLLRLNHRTGCPPGAPTWQSMNAAIIRVGACFKDCSFEENVSRCRGILERLKSYVYEGNPLIRVLFTMNDSLGHGGMILKAEHDLHTGALGHFDPTYWLLSKWQPEFENWLRYGIPAIVEGYENLVFGFNLVNEPQLPVGSRHRAESVAFANAMRSLSETAFKAGNSQFPIGIGIANTWQTCPSEGGALPEEWSRQLYEDQPYIHWVSGHWYQNSDPDIYMKNDYRTAIETERPYIIEEYGTLYAQPEREKVEAAFLEEWLVKRRAYAALGWALQDETVDRGPGDKVQGWDYVNDPIGTQNVIGVAANYAWNVLYFL